jgi:hypothetical protein
MGLEGKQKLKEQREFAKLIGGDMAAAAPAAAPAFGMPAGAQPSGDYTSTQIMGRVPGVVTTPIPDAAPMNALAPAAAPAAAPANALANANASQIQQTQKQINDLMQFAAFNPGMATQAMQQARLLQDQLEMFSRAKTPETAKLADRFVPVGRLVFDRETQQYISPSQTQLAQSQERSAAGGAGGAGAGAGGGRAAPAGKAPLGYRFTPTGDLEAIPGGPAAAKLGETAAKKDEGMTQASNILDSLEAAYTDLEARKAIPSEKRNAVANTLASISASAPGQIAERTIGTKAQTQRDVIASSRLQLLNAIKGATGMSSQQLNSNVELTTWLNSLTDPSRSIETNREILQNVRRFIDSGGTYTAKQGGKPAPAAGASNLAQERANANAAIAAGAPAAAVRQRFKQNTGQEL